MKPIKLKIKGLNSFIEEQTIDFEKLTDRGFFGIFGPTGSGKSTILDGITLALYGDVSRKSSNYINTNCDNLNVSFEFQISGAEVKKYRVSREFKRDKKSGNPISGKCKIVDITKGELVLADKVKTVTDKCKEVIGLSLEDFTRTVVLPQGKFSEFLKLEGKPRREMLERLFNLEKYGDNLSIKLSREINKEKTENSVLLGQLKGYEDISEEKKNEKNEELRLSIENFNNANNDLKLIEDSFKENQELWNLQLEVKEYKGKEKELIDKSEIIEGYKEKLKLAESALKVEPYILSYENTIKSIEETEKELNLLLSKVEILKERKVKAEDDWINARLRKDNELPQYKIKEERTREALNDKKALELLDSEIEKLKGNLETLKNKQRDDENKLKDAEDRFKRGSILVNKEEEIRENLNIDTELKRKVQEGVLITNNYDETLKGLDENKAKIVTFTKVINEKMKSKITLGEELDKNNKFLAENEDNLAQLIKNCPGNQNDLLELQKSFSEAKNKLQDFIKANTEIDKYKKDILKFSETLKDDRDKKINLEKVIEELKIEFKEIEIENLAHKLRNDLSSGDICPVCGSIEHHVENLKHVEIKEVKVLENNIKLKENELKNIEASITSTETKKITANSRIEENEKIILGLGKDFSEDYVKEIKNKFVALEKSIEEYNLSKDSLEKLIKSLKEENHTLDIKYKQLEVELKENDKQLKEIEEENLKKSKELEFIFNNLNKLKNETKVNDFIVKNDEILKVEKQIEEVEVKLKNYRKRLEELSKMKEDLVNDLNNTNQDLVKVEATFNERKNSREEKFIAIKNKVTDINNIEELLKSIEKVIKEIEDNFKNAEKLKEEINKSYDQCNNSIISLNSKNTDLYRRKDEDNEKLNNMLREESFLDIDTVRKSILDKNSIEELKLTIEKYNNQLARLKGAIESISKKISDRILTEEQWNNIQSEKKEKEDKVKKLNEIKIKVEQELNDINSKLVELKDLLKQKAELDHKLALLSDLDKLFKGKKFVEFVAATRLKYVSIEASNRLKEITNGNYGLEVDEDGRFIIRDYKNGGAERDASTLSGGETFLASLALALALSAEIQLKGTAPLELFFLDEGFGTLDDDLLEVVMSSLERIHNEKLKVGIISHVESIKNRVPVKLLITPAKAGMGGSKVKIERS